MEVFAKALVEPIKKSVRVKRKANDGVVEAGMEGLDTSGSYSERFSRWCTVAIATTSSKRFWCVLFIRNTSRLPITGLHLWCTEMQSRIAPGLSMV
jgi:hypothetical protein